MSESLTRSRRCNGRAAFHYVTEYLKIPGKTKCSDDAQVRRPAFYMKFTQVTNDGLVSEQVGS